MYRIALCLLAIMLAMPTIAENFSYQPLTTSTLKSGALSEKDVLEAGKSFAIDAKTATQGMVSTKSADYAVPEYKTTPKEAAYYDPNVVPKNKGDERKDFCASTDLAKLSVAERKECEAINFLAKRKNDSHFTLDKTKDPLFTGYVNAKKAATDINSSSCDLPTAVRSDAYTKHSCIENMFKPEKCGESLAVGLTTETKDIDYTFIVNTDLRKYRAWCNNDSGRFTFYGKNFELNKIVMVNSKAYRFVGIDISHNYGVHAQCNMEELKCDRFSCARDGTCQCVNSVATGNIVAQNQFLKEYSQLGEEDDANIWLWVDLEHDSADINYAELRDNGGLLMAWRDDPFQMQGQTAFQAVDKPSYFNCALFSPQNFRVVANASGGGCDGKLCTVGTVSVAEVDQQNCKVKLVFGKSGDINFHNIHDGAGARWTNKITLRMFSKVPTFHDDWHGNCPNL